jgi:flagellar biosynthesis/type III secretory pathway protein FliH
MDHWFAQWQTGYNAGYKEAQEDIAAATPAPLDDAESQQFYNAGYASGRASALSEMDALLTDLRASLLAAYEAVR